MSTKTLTLALLSLAFACDSATPPDVSPDEVREDFRRRRGECADFTTVTVSTGYKNGGYPPDWPDWAGEPYAEGSPEWRAAFDDNIARQTAHVMEAIYVGRQDTPDTCAQTCAEMDLGWDGGACVFDLTVSHDAAEPVIGYGDRPVWSTEVEASASLACSCG